MTTPLDLGAHPAELRERAAQALDTRIITVMAGKGGIGKSLFAKELAWLLDLVLVDLDWDGGCATRSMGYLHEKYSNAPLLDALESGRTPRPRHMTRRPDLIPSHPDFEANQPEADEMSATLVRWGKELDRTFMCDTHPGGSPSTLGACAAADLVIMPVVLGTQELNAVEQSLVEMSSYPLLLVPNWVPAIPPAAERKRLRDIASKYDVRVSRAFVSEYRWMRTRKLRTAITAAPTFSKRTAPVATDFVSLAEEVLSYAAA